MMRAVIKFVVALIMIVSSVTIYGEEEFYFEALKELVVKEGYRKKGGYELYKEVSKGVAYLISYKDMSGIIFDRDLRDYGLLQLNKLDSPNG